VDLLLADDQGEWAVEFEVACEDMAADFDEVALAVKFTRTGRGTEQLANVDALGQLDLDIGDDFCAWVIDLEHGQSGQRGIEEQRRDCELRTDLFDTAPFDCELAIVLREGEAAADVDVGAIEELACGLPDLDDAACVLDAIDKFVFAGELIEFKLGHAGMLAEFFDIGLVMPPLDAQRVFAARAVEGQRIEVLAFDAAVIWLGTERTCQLIA